MSQSADTVRNGLVLRVTLSATGEFRAIATDLAVKVAEQLGVRARGDGSVASAVEDLLGRVRPADGEDIALEFHKLDGELKIDARAAGRASEARIPLPA